MVLLQKIRVGRTQALEFCFRREFEKGLPSLDLVSALTNHFQESGPHTQMQQGENKGSGAYKYSQQMKGQGHESTGREVIT